MTSRDHVAFLRGISNVPMQPLRTALERLGLHSVGSFGASGNLFFRAQGLDPSSLEALIEGALGVEAVVRSRSALETIVRQDPFIGRQGAAVFLAKQPIGPMRAESLERGGFEGEPPIVGASVVYFVHPTRRPGRRTAVDFERELGVRGTIRSSTVLVRVLESL